MKPELTNLLHRLGTQLEGFQTLIIFPSGRAMATHRHGIRDFNSLTEMEAFAYEPLPDPDAPSTLNPQPAPQP